VITVQENNAYAAVARRRTSVLVTGLGVTSAIGSSVPEFTSNLFSGKSGIGPVEGFPTDGYDCQQAGEVHCLGAPQGMKGERDRTVWLACKAADEAVEDSGLSFTENLSTRTALVFGTSVASVFAFFKWKKTRAETHSNGVFGAAPELSPARIAGLLCERFGVCGGSMTVVTACSAGASAIAMATDLIRLRRVDVAIACAADPLSEVSFSGFSGLSALSTNVSRPFDQRRSGVLLGEGSGAIILEAEHHARKRGGKIYAVVAGYGLSNDAYHPTQPDPAAGGATRSINSALADAGIDASEMNYINAHGTSTKYNDLMELTAVRKIYGHLSDHIPISSIKPMIGHTLGAAGMIEAIATILALYHQRLPPTLNFGCPIEGCEYDFVPTSRPVEEARIMSSHSFAFGGNAACIIFEKHQAENERAR
jgi:3-oxoacyl-[acyl-carrier-protein] synthase II